ncbi:MAG: cytochrome ubiquinol oxidase subunit I [Burkholderiales bacterium]|nr:cytochrome ubiquinol oxidase subunit I [Burkholderiales bacterium]
MFNALELSRFQFAFTISFHILFPAFSMGLAMFLTVMEGLWLKTKNPLYYQIIRFWTKVFALTFGMGVVSGIVMEFQLGTNWAGFTKLIGGVLGPLFVYEVLSAFFIEAGFIGIMLFGWDKVGAKLHYLATILVTIGTTISAYWIMSANSWMQHPVGYQIINGRFVTTDWLAVVFNPYTFPRFIHMLLGAYLATSFVIISVSAYYLLHNKFINFAKKCLSSAIIVIAILIPLQIYMGDKSGLNIHESQPIKTAAIEGIWNTQKGAPLLLVALPSNHQQNNLFEIGIPYGAALINTHSINGELQGLKSVTPQDQPEVWIVFYCFRIMVGIGLAMLLYTVIALWMLFTKQLFTSKLMLFISKYMAPSGFIAIISGWFTAEIGRQPWIVYGLIRTNDAVSKVSTSNVLISLILMFIVYGIIFGIFYFYFLDKTIKKGPADFDLIQPFYYLSGITPEGDK